MRKEDLKNWTREQMKSEILRLYRKLELFGIKFEENPNNFSFSHHGYRYYAGKLVNDYVALKEENSLIKSEYNDAINSFTSVSIDNENLRRRIAKLESDICGTSPCIVSEFHSFEGESWIKATTYDDVLLRLKKANERISDLEKKRLNQGLDSFNGIEAMQKLNDELKAENQALKQHIKDMEDVCDGSCFSDYEDLPYGDEPKEKDALIAELQDQHQQDCIKINQLHVTIDTLVDMYSKLRKTVGID